jgi:penicillin-binding protein 2A
MAPTVFRTVADAILPNTAGTAFDVENAYVQNGIVAIQEEDTSASDSVVTSDQVQDITTQAQDLIEKTKQQILDANIPERTKTLWDTVRSWFE